MAVTWIKNAGAWSPLQRLYARDAGAWKEVYDGYVRDAGVWKKFHQRGQKFDLTVGLGGTGGYAGYDANQGFGSLTPYLYQFGVPTKNTTIWAVSWWTGSGGTVTMSMDLTMGTPLWSQLILNKSLILLKVNADIFTDRETNTINYYWYNVGANPFGTVAGVHKDVRII